MNSLASINVTKNGVLQNPHGVPLLFYWDGTGDVMENIKTSPEFRKWLAGLGIITELNKYTTSEVSLFYFTIEDGKEQYHEWSGGVQEFLPLSRLDGSDTPNLTESIIGIALHHLYRVSFDTEYQSSNTLTTEQQKDIFNQIKNKFGDRITDKTFLGGIRNYLSENWELISDNLEFVMSRVNKNIF